MNAVGTKHEPREKVFELRVKSKHSTLLWSAAMALEFEHTDPNHIPTSSKLKILGM